MAPRSDPGRFPNEESTSRSRWIRRSSTALLVSAFLTTQIGTVDAHGGEYHGPLSQGHGLLLIVGGGLILGGAILAKRTETVSPTIALAGVFVGIVVAAVGAVIFEGLSPDPTYTVSSMPFPRSWYAPIALGVGLLIATTSLLIGLLRWPTRPRYTFLGIILAAWIMYPKLLPEPASYSHPLGYIIVFATPALVGYIVWKDAWDVVGAVLRDPVVRWFAVGVAIVVMLFFMAATGYLSVFWEEGAPTEQTVVLMPVVYQLVSWPTLEIALPQIPLFVAISPGLIIMNAMLGILVGLNAALIARHWRVQEAAGLTEGTTGTAAIVGSCTCGCCGPLVAKFAVVAAGPSIAAPLYWLFVDSASPLGVLFVVGSVGLFTGTLVYSAASARHGTQDVCAVPAD